ncbi:MAG TPA: methyltransferase domain-containing protein [Polyangiaceae bacterium]|nr:methyltransferase domain-containing protein [Polyangiaceae bacterium]
MTTNETVSHYESLLAPIYTWMLGDLDVALARSRAELEFLGIGRASPGARALDLGAGTGLQSIPLHDLGYAVTAVDLSRELLSELSASRPAIRTVVEDITSEGAFGDGDWSVLVCMGDTLTHLPTFDAVDRAISLSVRALAAGGQAIFGFRDYTAAPPSSEQFIFVRGDDRRILTCRLRHETEAQVRVTDVVHERTDGTWSLRTSSYGKLRLSRGWVSESLRFHGARVTRATTESGRVVLLATKDR